MEATSANKKPLIQFATLMMLLPAGVVMTIMIVALPLFISKFFLFLQITQQDKGTLNPNLN